MRTLVGAVVTAILLAAPSAASAQTDKWAPWLGCWSLVTESVHEGEGSARAAALSPVDAASIAPDTVPRVCVVRAGNGVTTTTTAPGQTPITETIEADGPARPIRDGDCRGTERTQWSKNGKRLFARSEVSCTNQASRALTGMALITSSGHWLDVRSFHVDGRDATRVSRYERVAGVNGRGAPLTIDEIKEAAGLVAPAVLEAVIAETQPRLAINKKALIDLANAQVPTSVIDVMVAMAFPDKFVIDNRSRGGGSGASTTLPSRGGYDPFYWESYFYPAYYYSPFAYGYIGRYDPDYIYIHPGGGGGGEGGGGGGGGGATSSNGLGRVVNGQGYTRIRPAEAATPRPASGSGDRPVIRSESGGSSGTDAGANSSSGSSSSGSTSSGASSASPQGYSGGDGGSSSGRMAQPR